MYNESIAKELFDWVSIKDIRGFNKELLQHLFDYQQEESLLLVNRFNNLLSYNDIVTSIGNKDKVDKALKILKNKGFICFVVKDSNTYYMLNPFIEF